MKASMFFKEKIDFYIQKHIKKNNTNFYAPVNYILSLNSKRVRSSLFLHSCTLFNLDFQKHMAGALALEFFHNFTLIHDDIMDKAPLRRDQMTVHKKWDINTAILAGDFLMTEAYSCLHKLSEFNKYHEIFSLFNNTSIAVCKGQKMDFDFEKEEKISLEEYLLMIKLKTATLIACSLKMGALLANEDINAKHLYKFGENIGIAFQLQDDMLDIFSSKSGKTKGGDILLSKKTLPFILGFKYANKNQQEKILSLYRQSAENPNKITAVLELYTKLNIREKMLSVINKYYKKAFLSLNLVSVKKKESLIAYVNKLQNRFS